MTSVKEHTQWLSSLSLNIYAALLIMGPTNCRKQQHPGSLWDKVSKVVLSGLHQYKYKQGWSVDVMFSSLTGPCVKSRCITFTFQQTPQWTDHCVYTNSACLVSLFLCTEVLNCHNHWITCPIPACRTDQRQCRKSSLLPTTFIGWNNLPVPVEVAGCFHLCWMF